MLMGRAPADVRMKEKKAYYELSESNIELQSR